MCWTSLLAVERLDHQHAHFHVFIAVVGDGVGAVGRVEQHVARLAGHGFAVAGVVTAALKNDVEFVVVAMLVRAEGCAFGQYGLV